MIKKVVEGFFLFPAICIGWYLHDHKTHYYVSLAWLFWYVNIPDRFIWEEK